MPGHDIIVVGASAGGVEALVALTRNLPRDLPAAVFVVLHIPAQSPSLLPEILQHAGPLKASHPQDGEEIQHGHIYIAPPDLHILMEDGKIRLVHGPKENRHRPAIDPLFRSAAVAYGPRVVGVILSGSLDDGTAGLLAIKRQGGIAVIQNPKEALYASMPLHAKANVAVDYILPVSEIGPLLGSLAWEQVKEEGGLRVSEDLEKEVKATELDTNMMITPQLDGTPSPFSCPECGGVLWELREGGLVRFRCRVGHVFSAESVLAGQDEALEEALWVALKTLEENVDLSQRMARHAQERGQQWLAKRYEKKLADAKQHIALLRRVLAKGEIHIDSEAGEKEG